MENYKEKCPKCGSDVDFIPPSDVDKKERVLIVRFKCRSCNYDFIKNYKLL